MRTPDPPVPERRVRRAHALIGCWEAGRFLLRNYLSDRRIEIDPIITHVLDGFSDYTHPADALWTLSHVPNARALLRRLLERDVLLEEGSELDERDRALERSWRWGHEARFFHYATRDIPYEEDMAAQRASLLRLMRAEPPVGPFGEVEGDRVALAGEFGGLEATLGDTLLLRRTRRDFARRSLPFDLFGRLTLWTWGRTHLFESGEIGPYVLKTSPSGGARHSIEVYPIVLRVEGLRPGVYHYAVRDHALTRVRDGVGEERLGDIFPGQPWPVDAAVIYVMVSRIARSDWKYRHGHAYRVLLLDAGHLGQTFHLACTALGLATFTLAGFNDTELERTLGIDGVREIPLYAAACGYPSEADDERSSPDSPGG